MNVHAPAIPGLVTLAALCVCGAAFAAGKHAGGHGHGDEDTAIVWHFTKAGTVNFACLMPGHDEAGMKGAISVSRQ